MVEMESEVKESSSRWTVAVACFCMNFVILGMRRSTAVVYVALISEFGITREQASWPTMLCSSFVYLFGPLSGFLVNYFSIRTIVFCGCAIASASVSLCYFGHNLVFISIFFGVVQGIGNATVWTLNPVMVNQHFKKHKASATGFIYAGASIGSMCLPLLTDYILNEYGLHGCFLLLGGIIMQGLVAASFYRSPKVAGNKASQSHAQEHEVQKISPDTVIITKKISKLYSDFVHKFRNATTVLMHPSFAIISFQYTSFYICYSFYLTVFVDFASDRGISERNAALCITVLSVGDLMGRLFTGWISDFGFVSVKYVVTINLLGIAVLFMMISLISSYVAIMCWCVVLGVEIGCVLITLPVLMREHLGLERLPMAMGCSGFILGCILFGMPYVIGLYRDVLGSYDHLFQTLGAVVAFSALLSILKPLFQSCSKALNWSKTGTFHISP